MRNRGELSEGWYDPATLHKAVESAGLPRLERMDEDRSEPKVVVAKRRNNSQPTREEDLEESDSDDSIGPTLPGQEIKSRGRRKGPSIPNMQDLELKRGTMLHVLNVW